MDNFGVTYHGVPSYIKYSQRDDFVEPLNMTVSSYFTNTDAPLPEKIPVSEVGHPNVDGHSYSSFDLLQFIRRKGIFKAKGPKDEFRYPATTTMDLGWFNDDRDLCGNWFLVGKPAPRVSSDATRFLANLKPIERFHWKL